MSCAIGEEGVDDGNGSEEFKNVGGFVGSHL